MTGDLEARARDEVPGQSDEPPGRRRPSLVLPALLALGLVVYELTAQPGLGAAIACTKFGWDDFLTARWLRRRDPNGNRGRASFWLFVAAGLWKTAVTGVVVMFAVAFLEAAVQPPPPLGRPPQPPSEAIVGALLAALLGFGLSTLATARAFIAALRHHVRLWIDRRVHRDRRADHWPPISTPGRKNRAGAVLFTALFLGMLALLTLLHVILRSALQGWAGGGQHGQHVADTAANLICCGVFLLVPVLILVFRDILVQLALARSPAECWERE
jgi:uncharacterized membrane protein YhaH (DUF805 family)